MHVVRTKARLLEQEKGAFARVAAPCPYVGSCGGCPLQDLAYGDQLALKRSRLTSALASLGGEVPVELVPLEDPWRYRNKVELTFGEREGRLVLGYHAAGSFWRLVDVDDCLLLPEAVMRAARDVLALAAKTNLPAYQPRTHQGFFRHVVVRSSRAHGHLMILLVTAPGSRDVVERMAEELVRRQPGISSVYWGANSKVADVATPDRLLHLRGKAYLEESVGPFRVQLAPLSFLQPTTVQAERMYDWLCHALRRPEARVAWDLYCGLGLVALHLASFVEKVYGIDSEPHHLELAAHNAAHNGVENVEFRAGRVETALQDRRFWLREARPDLVVVDPPRGGLHPRALASVLTARPRLLAYCACHVPSLARDLQALRGGFPRYHLRQVMAFDMFPQTNHLEVVAVLERP